MWSYNFHLAFEFGLAANDVEFTTLITSWIPRAKEILAGKTFDQVWILDIVHSSKPGGCGGYQLTDTDWEWIVDLAPIRLGFITESVDYPEEDYLFNPALRDTKRILEKTLRHVTHVAAIDELDFPYISSICPIPVFWMVPTMPEALIAKEITTPPRAKASFIGTPYGERASWLERPVIKDWLALQVSPDNFTRYPKMFDELHAQLNDMLDVSGYVLSIGYFQYLQKLRLIHLRTFEMYLEGLREGSSVVHLPSFCQVYNSRVYEGMAAGRPVITSKGPNRPRLDAIFCEGVDVLVYPKDDPSVLAEHIQRVIQEPEFGRQVAMNARNKLLRFHTMERRVCQILEWLDSGREPHYTDEETSTFSGLPRKEPAVAQALVSPFVGQSLKPAKSDHKRTLRVLLINPPYRRFLNLSNNTFPLTFGNMGTMVSRAGHSVAIYDADFDKSLLGNSYTYQEMFTRQHLISEGLNNVLHPVWREIDRTIREYKPDVVGITAMTPKYLMVERIAAITKAINPVTTVVIGGHHPSIIGEQVFVNGNIDVVVVGEGEITFAELIDQLSRDARQMEGVLGILFRNASGKIIRTEPRAPITNLDLLPIADRDLILNSDYVSDNNIISTRGCPFSCAYCGADVIWKHKQRRRSVANVMEEVRYLISRSGSQTISFWDDSFTVNKKHTLELLEALKSIQGLTFSCITRLDLINYEIVTALKQTGCTTIYFGIESGNDRVLAMMNKHLTKELVREKTALVNNSGISWLGFFIMGYPGETREDILETLDFMKELDPPYAEINIFNPLPGTQTWRELEAEGKVCTTMNFSRHSQSSTDNLFINMPPEEFRELSLYVAREFDAHNARKAG